MLFMVSRTAEHILHISTMIICGHGEVCTHTADKFRLLVVAYTPCVDKKLEKNTIEVNGIRNFLATNILQNIFIVFSRRKKHI